MTYSNEKYLKYKSIVQNANRKYYLKNKEYNKTLSGIMYIRKLFDDQ